MDLILIIALAFFSISSFKTLSGTEFSQWATPQWFTLAVGILLMALCILRLIMYIRTFGAKQENREEKREENRARFEEEMRLREERRKAIYTYDEEDHPEAEVVTSETQVKTKSDEESEAFFDMLIEKASEEASEVSEENQNQ